MRNRNIPEYLPVGCSVNSGRFQKLIRNCLKARKNQNRLHWQCSPECHKQDSENCRIFAGQETLLQHRNVHYLSKCRNHAEENLIENHRDRNAAEQCRKEIQRTKGCASLYPLIEKQCYDCRKNQDSKHIQDGVTEIEQKRLQEALIC